ncbi:MAG: SLBB domain-containing protein [Acidobacteria bacterium]|nr:SLBB domain-containing protein [Acidobacteriota bacterium]
MLTKLLLRTLFTLLVFAPGVRELYGQQQGDFRGQQRDVAETEQHPSSTRAVDEADSRGAKEADRLVALPAERIILLLQQEPGLFLEVKKMLVRKAYAQGRVLDAKELSDEAVFRLVRDDEDARALITQQIVDRGYVRAKPTREELAREYEEKQRRIAARARREEAPYGYSEGNGIPADEQEEQYGTPSRQNQLPSPYQVSPPLQENPQPVTPETPLNSDQRRRLLEASTNDSSNDGGSGGLPFEAVTGGQQQMTADEAQQVVNSYGAGQLSGLAGGQNGVARSPSGISSSTSRRPQTQEEAYWQARRQLEQASLRPDSSLATRPRTRAPRQRDEEQPALLHRANPYADVPSLYDLYLQYSRRPEPLKRFGLDIFENGTGNFDQLPMDLPAGPEYVLGPGDGVNVDLWGSVSTRLHRTVDREGRLSLPEIGSIQVTGHNLGDVQRMVQSALRSQFRQVQADISLDRLRTVRVYVVGDVRRPGAYDISSLSTPLNALYEAGGPTSRGSMRIVKHYRGTQLVEEVDLYDLLLHGVHSGMQHLDSGDTILVPPLGQQVTVEGMVRRPAIYELAAEKSLADVLEIAGGVLPSGTLRHVDVERVQAHESRTMLRLDIPENNDNDQVTGTLAGFKVQDGDKIKISPILPFADKTVYLDGHVFRPGKYAYRDGMTVRDLVHSYSDLMPEPYKQHAELIRLSAPDLKPEIIAFNLEEVLEGKDQNLVLKPFDTVRIFGRFDFEDPPIITVSGEVRDPGDHVTNGATYLRDAIFLAGNTTPDAELNDVQVFRKTRDGKLEVLNADLSKAVAGVENENILLQPQDRVFVHKNAGRVDPPTVEVAGDVVRPGKYPLGSNLTATELVRVAGGLKRSAYAEVAELTRYSLERGSDVEGEHIPIKIGEALSGVPDTDMRLHAGDVLTIRQIAGWKDIGATVKVEGEVVHPGTYGIQEGERLSDVLARAGGLRRDAYAYGAIFERAEIREIEEKNRTQLITETKQEGTALGMGAAGDAGAREASMAQWRSTLEKLQTTPPIGRMVIHIGNGKSWAHTSADIQVRGGDSIYIPKRPNFVFVQGAVYNQTAISFRAGKSASWYLHQAGGPTTTGDKKNVFIVRANGTVTGGPRGLLSGGALDAPMQPGDMVVVPTRALGGGLKWRDTLQVAQLVSAVGIAVQVARSF